MNDIMADRYRFLCFICLSLIIAATIATTIIIIFINKNVVTPINLLSIAASKFVSDKDNSGTNNISTISNLNIHTGDEIEHLSEAIKTMEKDINNYIKNLTAITAEKERISAELNVATQIQASMLPCIFPAFPEREEFDIYATMQPAKEVGGDFYDYFLIDGNHLAVVIADVSGKGVPAALFMVIAKTLIKNQTQAGHSPEEVFTTVNMQLCENNEAGMFVTGWMGILEISTGKFTYVNAGHNPPLLKKKGQCYEYLKFHAGFVLAGMEGICYRQYELQLNPGDELYLYTDGVTEAMNAQNELYGEFRLQEVLNRNMDTTPSLLLPAVQKDIDDFVQEAPQFDDITMLALKIRGGCNE
jgi:sigma-B regulation protein RsbU (phosphoserine phosphatase)